MTKPLHPLPINQAICEPANPGADSPSIAHDYLSELRSQHDSGDNTVPVEAAIRYLQSFPRSVARIEKQFSSCQQSSSKKSIRALQSLCFPLAHPTLNLLCNQLEEIFATASDETTHSLLSLIRLEHARIRPELEKLANRIEPAESLSRPATIMVISDDDTLRTSAKNRLENSGFQPVVEASGISALRAINKKLPDAILVDINDSPTSGAELCRQIRLLPNTDHLPVLMVTGHEDDTAIELSFDARATDFIRKPLNWPILILRLRYLLRSARTFSDLVTTQARLADAQRFARIGHWDHNLATNQLLFSDEFYEVIGHPSGAFSQFNEFLRIADEGDRSTAKEAFCNEQLSQVCECKIHASSGEIRVIRIKSSTLFSANNEPLWVSGMIQDVTDQRRDQEIIHRLAYYDELTGLFNRTAFNQEMERALKLHQRVQMPLAIAYMDLDGFKLINDSLGHHAGDQLLKAFATRLASNLRSSDAIMQDVSPTLARLGGDEFTLMLSGLQHKEDAAIIAQRIVDSLKLPFLLEAESSDTHSALKEVYITTSIGIAIFPEDGTTLVDLQKNADKAMYMAKQSGKNAFRYYQQSMDGNAHARLRMETLLRKAIDANELTLVYQPQMQISSGRMVGVEALLRWTNAELGAVSPADFIPTAEETGLIIPISEWVLREACRQLQKWLDLGLNEFHLAVNLNGLQFRQPGFSQQVKSILDEFQLTGGCLELEVTESILMTQIEQAITTMNELKKLGLKLSVDDFGTGYSSLSDLTRFPIDTLKIDQSFISNLGGANNNDAITRAIIAMAKNLDLMLIAEGVETAAQLEFLADQKCELAQGYFYSKPLPAAQLEAFYHHNLDALAGQQVNAV